MGNFNRDSGSGGRQDFGRRGFGGRGDRPSMHRATCAKCGNECEVPFKPSGDKPVYCSKCFEDIGGSVSKRFGDRNHRQPQSNTQLEAINTKLDKILAILERTSVKPAEEPKIEKEIEIQPEKPIVIVEKKTKASKKTAPTPEE